MSFEVARPNLVSILGAATLLPVLPGMLEGCDLDYGLLPGFTDQIKNL